MELVKNICKKCGILRKFVKDSLRDKEQICGQCWDWTISDEDYLKKIGTPNN
jgi:hypothetical protein